MEHILAALIMMCSARGNVDAKSVCMTNLSACLKNNQDINTAAEIITRCGESTTARDLIEYKKGK